MIRIMNFASIYSLNVFNEYKEFVEIAYQCFKIMLSLQLVHEFFIIFYHYPVFRVNEEYDVYTYVHTFMKFVYTVIVHNVNNILCMLYTKLQTSRIPIFRHIVANINLLHSKKKIKHKSKYVSYICIIYFFQLSLILYAIIQKVFYQSYIVKT